MGMVWSVPVPFKENDRASTKGGGNRIIGGGSKTVLREGFYGMFSPPPFVFLCSNQCSNSGSGRPNAQFRR